MEMALEEINIRDHGDELKLHLAGIRGNITPCSEVPTPVKEAFNAEILAKKSFQSSQEISKSIGRFFYEAGIDFDAIRSPSFQRMVKSTLSPGQTIKFPSCQELNGWILEDAVQEMQQYVTEIRKSWASTGCSILLDGWIDLNNRNLINILVYSPRGTIYLRSSYISSFSRNVDAMLLFLEGILEEVGVENVVQIVAYTTSFWTEALMAVKATIPLVEVIKFLNGTNKAQVGFIYDTLDQAKETIEKEFESTRFCHAKIWNAIDDTWNKYLHSPLHDAAYYLNPTFFHSSNWYLNVKISGGLCSCITGMAEDRRIKDLITQQLGTFDFLSSEEILHYCLVVSNLFEMSYICFISIFLLVKPKTEPLTVKDQNR
ncbi:hypothetical protein KY289_035590 [Solanum tuberosum]|nr:hypothetical protein KY289_035590 [Solanum tuberosum]